MILNKDELRFLKENREIIEGLLNKRIDDFKDAVIESKDEERESIIKWVKEMKRVLMLLKNLDTVEKTDTGI
jgi:hypothetical protein